MPNGFSIGQIRAAFPDITFHREVEEGNIKQVFEAELDGQHIAFKVVPYEEGSRLEGYTEREIDIMKNTDSDVLVDLIDAFDIKIEGVPSYVIIEEWIEGDSLKYLIGEGEYSIDLAFQVTDAILDVLPEFDSGDIVHRDIKPENIRKSDAGYIRLLDVGVARMNQRETLTPKYEKRGPGTPAYSAPEVLRNERYNQDVKTDLFSTGIVFFEAATGDQPFGISGIETIPDAILQDTRSDFSGYLEPTEFKQNLDSFYKRMTEHEPANRYRKAEHAKDDLDDIVEEWL